MPNKGVVSFSDPLLSEKLLNFENYSDENKHSDKDITIKIVRDIYHYTDCTPVYYQSNHSPTALNAFIHAETKKFRLLMTEFERCIEYLDEWVLKETIMIQFGENDTLIPADSIFDYFLERLKGDDFSDHRTILYSDGKKNLEIIAVLVREASISLEFRKKEIINMLSDDGLTLCSGGCLARLSDAAENLKNYGKLTPSSLIKTFIVGMAKETTLRKESFFRHNYSESICLLANILIAEYEVHAMNYLLERLKSDLSLDFLKIPNDPHIETIKLYLKDQQSTLDIIYVNYRHAFQRQINASNLINFISYQLYEGALLQSGEGYHALKTFIEGKLEDLGNDPTFSWGEIFSEDGCLKKVVDFRITVAERLLDSQWLDLRSTYLGPCFRFYSNNLVLSWVKLNEIRRAVVDVIAKEDFAITNDIFLNTENLKFLLQNKNDIYLFFKKLPLCQHKKVLDNMASINFDLSLVLCKRNESIGLQGFYNLMMSLSEEGRCTFVQSYSKLVHSVLCQLLEKADCMDDSRWPDQINHFITLIINAGFKNFTDIVFKKSKLAASGNGASYMKNINFSGVELCNTVFYEPIFGCNFSHANLTAANFQNIDLKAINFDGACLSDCNLETLQLKQVNFRNVNLKDASFQCTFLGGIDFEDADLTNCNFESSSLKQINFRNVNLKGASFQYASLDGVDFENADLTNCNFESSSLEKIIFMKVNLDGASFTYADLYEANFTKSAGKVNFSLTDLKKVNFSRAKLRGSTFEGAQLSPDRIGFIDTAPKHFNFQATPFIVDFEGADLANCNFDKSTLENISFKSVNLQHASFKAALLNNLNFFNSVDLSYTDFSKATLMKVNFSIAELAKACLKAANLSHVDCLKTPLSSPDPALFLAKLNKVNFQGATLLDCKFEDFFLKEVKFVKATLEGVSFIYSNLTRADFSKSILKNINFSLAKLKNISFKSSDLTTVRFNEASLKKINFLLATLQEVNFQDAALEAVFTKASLVKLNFERANLANCNFDESILKNISFRGTNLQYASFKKARLIKLNFFNNVDLSYANFSEAILDKVNFSLTEYIKASLKAAKLNCSNVVKTQLKNRVLAPLFSGLRAVNFQAATLLDCNFEYLNLENIVFVNATLEDVSFKYSNLKDVNFNYVNLAKTQLRNTQVTKLRLTGTTFTISQLGFFYKRNTTSFDNLELMGEYSPVSNRFYTART